MSKQKNPINKKTHQISNTKAQQWPKGLILHPQKVQNYIFPPHPFVLQYLGQPPFPQEKYITKKKSYHLQYSIKYISIRKL